jgi:hypothetical protein
MYKHNTSLSFWLDQNHSLELQIGQKDCRQAGIDMNPLLTKKNENIVFVMPEVSSRASMFLKMDSRLRGNDVCG